jgi:hypothetical protein
MVRFLAVGGALSSAVARAADRDDVAGERFGDDAADGDCGRCDRITRLRKALEVAHGENLELRRRLAVFDAD